ncbi:MAG: aminopeptidase [Gordonibacter sp.]|uniref:aminopeptidase n=1 Tax=Gordonibacter sp. TaxID=1968902 RepID=UPI002FCAD5C5
MPEIVDHVAYLSQQIGPRPAGTEEEQQAALYITEQMQKDAGLSAVIEDFAGAANEDIPRAICCAVTLVVAVLALFVSMLAIPAILIALAALLLFAAEVFDKPVLSKLFARGVSQNVVAKYEPGYTAETGGSRRRKVVLVAHYDSGKVRSELKFPFIAALPVLRWINLGAMAFVPLLLLVRTTLFLHATGVVEIALNVLLVIALVFVALPIIEMLAHKFAAYNEAANCNAAGVAVLLDVARRVGRGRVSEAELASSEEATIHGEEAARAAGLVPEGVEIVYAASKVKPPEIVPQSEGARLAAAKAAVAALTGKPVSGRMSADLAANLVQVKEPALPIPTDAEYQAQRDDTREAFMTIPPETVQTAIENAAAAQGDEDPTPSVLESYAAGPVPSAYSAPSDNGGVPDWFKKAQEKAKKPAADNKTVQRSRYADALEAALAENADHSDDGQPRPMTEIEARLQSVHEGIREIRAPQLQVTSESGEGASPSPSVQVLGGDDPIGTEAPQLTAQPGVDPFSAPLPGAIGSPEPGATSAMPPIDVNELRLGNLPSVKDVRMPSFLDPARAQAEKLEERGDQNRTARRVDVTAAEIGASGRIKVLPPAYSDASGGQDAQGAGTLEHATQRRPIVLPDIGMSTPNLAPITELPKQRAPLAEVEASGKSAAKSLLTMLPSIVPAQEQEVAGATGGFAYGEGEPTQRRSDLRTALPSLSGSISRQDESAVSTAGSFAPAGATGAFAPIGDELLENVDPDDIYVDDADDSAYDGEYTETGAFAGPGYVEMPTSRGRRLFDKLRSRKRKKEVEPSPQEWLDVDESFDARSAGAARGGWESFQEEDQEGYEDGFEERSYTVPENEPLPYYAEDDAYLEDDEFPSDNRPRWNGGGFSRQRLGRANEIAAEGYDEDLSEPYRTDFEAPAELDHIYQFRNPDVNTEVWFVALGSELAHHGGMRAFLAEHNQDLRGSIIIDLDALGAGNLSLIEREGSYRKAKASSRMRRYTKKASQATGIPIETGAILWQDSAASTAIRQGFQAMHLAGMDGAKPAFYAQGDDVLENIDEETLGNSSDFVMELLKNI